LILLSLLIFTLYRLATPPVHFVSLWGVTLALQRVGWFVLILFPLKKALEWGLREGVKN